MSFFGPSIIGYNGVEGMDAPFLETQGFIRAFGPNLGDKLTIENNSGDEIFNVDTATPLISIGADLVPTIASTTNLGSASLPFDTVYADSIVFPTFTPNAIAQTDGSSHLFSSNTIAKTGSGTTVNAFTVQNTSMTAASQIAIQFDTRSVSDQIVFGQSSAITHFTIPNSGLIIEGTNNPNKLFIQDSSTNRIFQVSTNTGAAATKNNTLDDGTGIMTVNITVDGTVGRTIQLVNDSGIASSGIQIAISGTDNNTDSVTQTISWTPNTAGSYVTVDGSGVQALTNFIISTNTANGIGSFVGGLTNVIGLSMTGSNSAVGLYWVASTTTLYVNNDINLVVGQQIFFAFAPGDQWYGIIGSVVYDGGSNSTAITVDGVTPSGDESTPPTYVSAGSCSIAVGEGNTNFSSLSVIAGSNNSSLGDYMYIMGGNMSVTGQSCVVLGDAITVNAQSMFAWSDGSADLNITSNNTFTILASSGLNLLGNQVITFGSLASNVVSINQVALADGITDNFNLMTLLTESTDATYTKNAYYLGSGSGLSDMYIIPDYQNSAPTSGSVQFDVAAGTGTANFSCFLESSQTVTGNFGMFTGGGSGVTGFFGSPATVTGTAMIPATMATDLGTMTNPFQSIYLINPVFTPSDRNLKKSIVDLAVGLELVNCLKPVSYQLIAREPRCVVPGNKKPIAPSGKDSKTHWGIIAQDLEHALITCGLTSDTLGVLAKSTDAKTGILNYAVAYTELIPVMLLAFSNSLLRWMISSD